MSLPPKEQALYEKLRSALALVSKALRPVESHTGEDALVKLDLEKTSAALEAIREAEELCLGRVLDEDPAFDDLYMWIGAIRGSLLRPAPGLAMAFKGRAERSLVLIQSANQEIDSRLV